MSLAELKEKMAKANQKAERTEIRKEVREEMEQERDPGNGDVVIVGADNSRVDIRKSIDSTLEQSHRRYIQQVHDLNDAAYLLMETGGKGGVQKMHRFLMRKSIDEKIRKAAMDTADTANWVPVEMSGTLIDMIRYNLLVADLFPEEYMPTGVYDPPFLAGAASAYLLAESTDSTGTKAAASVLTDGKATLTSKKLGARIILSTELTEDAVFDVLSKAREEIARAIAEAKENAIVNGDTTTPHAGADVDPGEAWTATAGQADPRYAFDGIRKKYLENSLTTSLSTFSAATLSRMIADMGAYASVLGDLVWLVNSKGLHKIRVLSEFLTVDNYGPNATILKGEVGQLFGAAVVLTGKLANNQDANGVYDTSSPADDKTTVLLVNRRTWLLGDRRKVTLKSWEDIQTDQQILVATERSAFRQIYLDGQTYGRAGIAVDW